MVMQVRGSHWVVGIDAGATSTKGVLVNLKGDDLASGESSPFNLRFQKAGEFEEIVVQLVYDLINKAHLGGHVPGAIGIGVAGAGRERDRDMLHDAIANRFQQSVVLLHHDAYIAHYGAFAGRPGVLVTAGTGSIAFGRNAAGEERRAGGWGWMLGDEGSGWWIGREAIRAALAAWEGSGPDTRIEEMVCEHFYLETTYDVIPQIYREKIARRDVTLLAEPVAELAKAGDAVASRIYHEAGRALGRLAVVAGKHLGLARDELRVSMLGSISVGDWELLETGVWEILGDYSVGTDDDAQDEKGEESSREDSHAKSPGKELHTGDSVHMPQIPPKDLTLDEEKGPHLERPEMSAVRGAAQWAIDGLQHQMFA
jgi:N-acetylglucosamine kinase-like BadF-type ATPase